jgi:phage head maturation protease
LSIGFKAVTASRDRQGLRRLQKIDLWEISLVTFPMQQGARVISVRKAKALAEAEQAFGVLPSPPR